MDVTETLLPGIGVRYQFRTEAGRSVTLVVHRNGRQELSLADPDDEDAMREVLVLTPAEGDALAELLGAPRMVEHLADLHREIPELVTERIVVPPGSPYAGHPLGDTRLRTRTGASAVALVRGPTVIASPTPAEVLQAGDTVVVVGTPEGCRAAAAVLGG